MQTRLLTPYEVEQVVGSSTSVPISSLVNLVRRPGATSAPLKGPTNSRVSPESSTRIASGPGSADSKYLTCPTTPQLDIGPGGVLVARDIANSPKTVKAPTPTNTARSLIFSPSRDSGGMDPSIRTTPL